MALVASITMDAPAEKTAEYRASILQAEKEVLWARNVATQIRRGER